MLAGNFYQDRSKMLRGRGNSVTRKGWVDAPKLSAGSKGRGGGGRGGGRPAGLVKPIATSSRSSRSTVCHGQPPVRQVSFDDTGDKESDKENVPEQQENAQEQEEDKDMDGIGGEGNEEDDDEDEEWKFKLIDVIQQYPEVYDLAHPRYKDRQARDATWE